MSSTFAKLNLKDHAEILVLNAPASFEPQIKSSRLRATPSCGLPIPRARRRTTHASSIEDNGWAALGEARAAGKRR